MPFTTYPLKLGSFTFAPNTFEGPNADGGALGDLGSHQKSVVRELPGGVVTAQLLGSFPKVISWSGILFGSTAQSRAAALQQLVDNGDQITFSWAQWSFDGFAEDFECFPHSVNEIHFKITFRPVKNNNSVTGGNAIASGPNTGVLSNALATMVNQLNNPTSGYTFPPAIASSTNTLSNKLSSMLQNSGGTIAGFSTSDIGDLTDQVSSLKNQLSPPIKGSDPVAASAAADLNGTVGIIGTTASSAAAATVSSTTLIDPDIYQLAAQKYGDVTQYQAILDASNLTDPLPSGQVDVTVPALVLPSTPASPTVLAA